MQAGPALQTLDVSRGAAFGDLDNDGDVDVLVANDNGKARLLINESAPGSTRSACAWSARTGGTWWARASPSSAMMVDAVAQGSRRRQLCVGERSRVLVGLGQSLKPPRVRVIGQAAQRRSRQRRGRSLYDADGRFRKVSDVTVRLKPDTTYVGLASFSYLVSAFRRTVTDCYIVSGFSRTAIAICLVAAATACSRAANDQRPSAAAAGQPRPCVLPDLTRMEPSVQQQMREAQALLEKALAPGAAGNGAASASGIELAHASGAVGEPAARRRTLTRLMGFTSTRGARAAGGRSPCSLGGYRTRGDVAAAAGGFGRVLALQPDDVAALVWLGHIHMDEGRPEVPRRGSPGPLARQPRTVAALVGQGRAALARRRLAHSRAESLEQRSRSTRARRWRALPYRRSPIVGCGNIDRAKRACGSGAASTSAGPIR